jgi:hypothetical protein
MQCVKPVLLVAVLLGLLSNAPTSMAAPPPSKDDAGATARPLPVPMASFAELIERVLPAVVSIRVTGESLVPVQLRQGDGGPTQPSRRPFRSGGSGVIVNAELGLIATNHHVVRDAVTIEVGLHDGREAPATLIGVDSGTDIAMIRIDMKGLTSLPFGDASQLRVGDFVIAIGNPFGLEGSASSGIVSGLKRSGIGYDIYESFIQVDAAVNPGKFWGRARQSQRGTRRYQYGRGAPGRQRRRYRLRDPHQHGVPGRLSALQARADASWLSWLRDDRPFARSCETAQPSKPARCTRLAGRSGISRGSGRYQAWLHHRFRQRRSDTQQ